MVLLFTGLSQSAFSKNAVPSDDSVVWKRVARKQYTIHYTSEDGDKIVNSIEMFLRSGFDHISGFFKQPFASPFDVYIFPSREKLDLQWQKDWGDTTFRSQCWMVASGVGHRLDILSPNAWAKQACDHSANDTAEIRRVTWHELTHVFHGQYNPDHTFSSVEKLDWLVEGVATYVSGQLDGKRLHRVKQMINENKVPSSLDDFWKGQEKYGLSGSIVAFIDKKYGRDKLFGLLNETRKETVLRSLAISESGLIGEWKGSLQ
jgi:hypothetical protein